MRKKSIILQLRALLQAVANLWPQNVGCRSRIMYPFFNFTVMDGSEGDGDLVLIQTFPLYYVNQVILMLTSIFQGQFP